MWVLLANVDLIYLKYNLAYSATEMIRKKAEKKWETLAMKIYFDGKSLQRILETFSFGKNCIHTLKYFNDKILCNRVKQENINGWRESSQTITLVFGPFLAWVGRLKS